MKGGQRHLEFVFGHTLHFTELISYMVWGIAVSFEKPVKIYILVGECYIFIEGRIPRGGLPGFSALPPERLDHDEEAYLNTTIVFYFW
jgi:hypothetical protein